MGRVTDSAALLRERLRFNGRTSGAFARTIVSVSETVFGVTSTSESRGSGGSYRLSGSKGAGRGALCSSGSGFTQSSPSRDEGSCVIGESESKLKLYSSSSASGGGSELLARGGNTYSGGFRVGNSSLSPFEALSDRPRPRCGGLFLVGAGNSMGGGGGNGLLSLFSSSKSIRRVGGTLDGGGRTVEKDETSSSREEGATRRSSWKGTSNVDLPRTVSNAQPTLSLCSLASSLLRVHS